MNKIITWVYVCDPPQDENDPKDGLLYIAKTTPETIKFDSLDGWVCIDRNVWWYSIDRDTMHIKLGRDYIYPDDINCTKDLAEAILLDLSDIPVPSVDDKNPIVVIQTITQSINYYTEV